MKPFTLFLLGLCLSLPIFADDNAPDAAKLPPDELDKLVSPIALYPDSLIALILPASTTSSDVVLAARFLANGGEPDAIDNQPWSDSVKSLGRYPDLVKWMDENLDWTRQLGEVFEAQPADVMTAIQRMRAQARASGLLTDTPQQRVVMQENEICIVPAEPDVIYVPRYDPEVLWMHRPYYGDFISFGVGFSIGSWLYFDCDWFGRSIWVHHRSPGWVYHPGWRRPPNEAHVVMGAPWHPDFRHHEQPVHRPMPIAIRPHVISGPRWEPRNGVEHRHDQPERTVHLAPGGRPPGGPVSPPNHDSRDGIPHVQSPQERSHDHQRSPNDQPRANPTPRSSPQPAVTPPAPQVTPTPPRSPSPGQGPSGMHRSSSGGGAEHRARYDNPQSPQTPRPPSHTPVTTPTPTPTPSHQPPPSAPHPSSSGRSGTSGGGSTVTPSSRGGSAPAPAPSPAPAAQKQGGTTNSDDHRRGSERGGR